MRVYCKSARWIALFFTETNFALSFRQVYNLVCFQRWFWGLSLSSKSAWFQLREQHSSFTVGKKGLFPILPCSPALAVRDFFTHLLRWDECKHAAVRKWGPISPVHNASLPPMKQDLQRTTDPSRLRMSECKWMEEKSSLHEGEKWGRGRRPKVPDIHKYKTSAARRRVELGGTTAVLTLAKMFQL